MNHNNSHPIIPNAKSYFTENKFVAINSEDRNILKYPNSSSFEIELPQDYTNIQSVRLSQFSFPSKHNLFSISNNNIYMTFKITEIYNPIVNGLTEQVLENIYNGLTSNLNNSYVITIEEGNYYPLQMATELTNKMNDSVTKALHKYFNDNNITTSFIKYDRFKIVYNEVSKKLWFGNSSDKFLLEPIIDQQSQSQSQCENRYVEELYINDGLPSRLGLPQEIVTSIKVDSVDNIPRFYYGYDNAEGYWLSSPLIGSSGYIIESQFEIDLIGQTSMFLDIDGLNCIDTTSIYNDNTFTRHTNLTNGVVNSSFARISIPEKMNNQYYFDDIGTGDGPYKLFNPPAERIRRLKVKLKFHNGQLVNFGNFKYTFMLEFKLRKQHISN